jgi:hypothetical protein
MADETKAKEEVIIEPQTEPTPIETTGSEPITTPSKPLESSTTTDTPSLANNDNQGLISENNPIIPTESEKPLENQAPVSEPNEIKPELEKIPENPENIITEVKTPVSTPESPTAQIPVNEPLAPEPEIKNEPIVEPIQTESKPVEIIHETKSGSISEPEQPKPIAEVNPVVPVILKSKSLARELLITARNMIQLRKRKKLDKIMTLFAKQTKITNDEVEKFMHVSDATAGRYFSILVKENKIKQSGKTGKSVFYSKI